MASISYAPTGRLGKALKALKGGTDPGLHNRVNATSTAILGQLG